MKGMKVRNLPNKEKAGSNFPVIVFFSCILLLTLYHTSATRSIRTMRGFYSYSNTHITHPLADVLRTFENEDIRMKLPSGRLIVMTMNRAESLQRLLNSIRSAYYEADRVDLDIWIDRLDSTAPLNRNISGVVTGFSWPFGAKTIYTRRQPGGLYQQWMYTWDLNSPGDVAVILEDDLEVSPAFYQWLKIARSKYGNNADVGGYTLQRSVLRPRKPPPGVYQGHLRLPADVTVFKYRLQGSWGFAPEREKWREFLRWFEEKRMLGEKPYVDDLITTAWYKGQERGGDIAKTMWTQWWIKFVDERNYFCVTAWPRKGTALAANWKEPGLHFAKTKNTRIDHPIYRGAKKDFIWPKKLIRLDWDGTVIPERRKK